jgi:FtsP/CotA-like multicopper oxidase with cupredoxin domain
MNRRQMLAGIMAGTAALSLPLGSVGRAAAGETARRLAITRRTIEVNGRAASVFGLTGPNGKPGLSFTEGEAFNALLRNDTDEATIIHWHGLTPPWPSDGVPDQPAPLIAGRDERSYDFPVGEAGTHWMHAHTLQEQALLAAPLIVAPARPADEQEVVVLLHDFSFKTPEELLASLTGAKADPMAGMDHSAHGAMNMPASHDGPMAMDLNDIEYDAYLANDRTLDDPEVVGVERGGRVRLRVINGATATAFTIDLGGLEGELIAVDGREGEPQRAGIILRPAGANVTRIAVEGEENGPVLDLSLEARLSAARPLAPLPANEAYQLALDGDMAAYRWSLAADRPILVTQGDRAEVELVNRSMMAHPMHLHGHHFQVVAIDGQRFAGAVRDTVLVPPRRSVTVAVDANNPGQWAFHCHHLYHMAAGMMTTFGYG